jgi:hypothetical protein
MGIFIGGNQTNGSARKQKWKPPTPPFDVVGSLETQVPFILSLLVLKKTPGKPWNDHQIDPLAGKMFGQS